MVNRPTFCPTRGFRQHDGAGPPIAGKTERDLSEQCARFGSSRAASSCAFRLRDRSCGNPEKGAAVSHGRQPCVRGGTNEEPTGESISSTNLTSAISIMKRSGGKNREALWKIEKF